MPSTTNFGWTTPADTDLVKDGAAAIRTLGNGVDASFVDLKGGTTGQILSKNSNTDLDFTWIANDQGDITAVTAGTGISGGGTSGAVTITNSMATEITAAGDIIVGTGSGTFDNLPIGTTGQVLTADTTVSPYKVKWATAAASGSTLLAYKLDNYGSNYSTTSTTFVDVNATNFALTVTAPASGNIVLRASMPIEFNGSGQAIFNWREGTTDLTNTNFIAVNNGSVFPRAGTQTFNAYLSGVSAGSHTYKLGFRSTSGSTFFGYTNGSPFLLEAWSA